MIDFLPLNSHNGCIMSIATPDSREITTMNNHRDILEVKKSSTPNWFFIAGGSIVNALRTSAAGVLSVVGKRKTNDTVDSTGSLTDPSEPLDTIEEQSKASLEEQEVEKNIRSALDETLTEWTVSHVLAVSKQEVDRNAAKLLENAPEGFDEEQALKAVCGMDKNAAVKKVTLGAVKLMMESRQTEGRDENGAIKAMLNGMEPKTSEITASVKEVLAGIFEQGIKDSEK